MLLRTIAASLVLRVVVGADFQAKPRRGILAAVQTAQRCRYIPEDAGWPGPQLWSQLNQTVHGRLIATVPVGSVCHEPTYDEDKCKELSAKWGLARVAYVSLNLRAMTSSLTLFGHSVPRPAEFLSLYFQNNTCTPFTPRPTKCELGNYASYSIDVRSIDDVRAGISFARKQNIRLVMKNLGHE
jgi:hypothetical protein